MDTVIISTPNDVGEAEPPSRKTFQGFWFFFLIELKKNPTTLLHELYKNLTS